MLQSKGTKELSEKGREEMVHREIGNWVGFGVVVVGIFRVDIGRVVKDVS